MIFLTTGTQLPFDRLVKIVDEYCALNPTVEVFGQIGCAGYRPKHFEFCDYLRPEDYDEVYAKADIVISHAGMGTIINCLLDRKLLMVMARSAELGEHRNNHQLATMKRFQKVSGCIFFDTLSELSGGIGRHLGVDIQHDSPYYDELLSFVENFISEK